LDANHAGNSLIYLPAFKYRMKLVIYIQIHFMKPKLYLLLLFCMIRLAANAQNDTSVKSKIVQKYTSVKVDTLKKDTSTILVRRDTSFACNIGDSAPSLRVKKWIKGTPIKNFEKGKVYVIEFWATWCRPCIAAMPHLSDLARLYKDKVTFAAIDVLEKKTTSLNQVKSFIESMGLKMDFNIATEDTSFTSHDWLDAFNEKGSIPKTFVIDGQGKVAWLGHPFYLDTVLKKIVSNTWNINEALSKRNYENYIENLDFEIVDKVHLFQGNYDHLEDIGQPDSTLLVVNGMVKKEPNLKYAPWIMSYTFSALLRTDPHKAYEFGKIAIGTAPYGSHACKTIINDIQDDSRKVNMTSEIYLLGAECYQTEIDQIIYPELEDVAKLYHEMATYYRLAGDNSQALKAEKNAIKFWEKDLKTDQK
jgi:thiol-disulfide isomerase/thioredoxin